MISEGWVISGSDELLRAEEDRGVLGITINSPVGLGSKLSRKFHIDQVHSSSLGDFYVIINQ